MPPPPRSIAITHYVKWFRITSFPLLMLVGSFIPTATTLTTCRCCLFTAACGLLPVHGYYDVADRGGVSRTGVYNKPNEVSWSDYKYEKVHVRRTRYGWPLRFMTVDEIDDGSEWHRVFEGWFWFNLFFLFLLWLTIQGVVTLVAKRLERKNAVSSAV
jgi:hypothetical protein